jgi:dTDP-6-deoxy-L-talose 4-dehydrogenase (NAD+)
MSQGGKMKVLVTGATGFIGNYVIQELLNQEQQVIATSRNAEKAKSCDWFSQVQYIPCDLNVVQDSFFDFFHQPELLIHLAWEGLPNYQELFHLEKNLFSNYRFLENILTNGLRKLVVAGTCFEYGMQNGPLSENMETKPNNPYGLAKDTLRKFLEQLQKTTDFEFKWVRLFYIYGKGQSPNAILSQLERALENGETFFNMSGGKQLRDYLPVEKVAKYIVKIARQNRVTGVINCSSGTPISIGKLVENYLKEKKKSIHLNLGYYPYPEYESMAFWGDTSKLRMALGE